MEAKSLRPAAAAARPARSTTPPRTPQIDRERPPNGAAGGRVPHPHRPVGAAGGQQQPPVGGGAERHRGHLIAVADERLPGEAAGDRVPHPHRCVGAAGGQQQLPAGGGAERHRGQLPGVADERLPRGRPVTGSHTRTVPSVLPETSSSRPSRVVPNATEDTSSLWAASGSPTRLPVTGSHTRTVLWLPEASSRRPSGPLLCRSKIRLHG